MRGLMCRLQLLLVLASAVIITAVKISSICQKYFKFYMSSFYIVSCQESGSLQSRAICSFTCNSSIHTLSNFMELDPYWEAANCVASQELPSNLWNPKVHCHFHKSHPVAPTLSQIDSVHTIQSYTSKIHFNTIH
jgi:hypothetical protein